MRNATARAWEPVGLHEGQSQPVQSCANQFGRLFGPVWRKTQEEDGGSVLAPGSASVALPDISSLDISLSSHTVGREQEWLSKVIPAPERFLSDLWPCLQSIGIEERDWPVVTIAHEIAIHYWRELHAWAKDNRFNYQIGLNEQEYSIDLALSYSSFLEYDMYIVPLEILNKYEFADYGLCRFIGQGMALLKTIGFEDGDDWVEWYLENQEEWLEEDEEPEIFLQEIKPRIQQQRAFHQELTKFSDNTRCLFETYIASEGVDLFWQDWGRKILSAIDNLGDLGQFNADADECDDDCDDMDEYKMSFREHFAVGNAENEVWDFMNDMFRDKIYNEGFFEPTVQIRLSKGSLDEALFSLKQVSETGRMLYNLGEVACDLCELCS
ncbi:hypothetical protein [Pseudodesulfovibrio pelocollis]|uniref:hypothetical protein n=1 Tax=Pseudodesulfovibrio pelocollis TaxID=3051432 RepID=UPI00255B3C82|nr:hypothetical protein [Pseudodesulfovibrio sp. SB368]